MLMASYTPGLGPLIKLLLLLIMLSCHPSALSAISISLSRFLTHPLSPLLSLCLSLYGSIDLRHWATNFAVSSASPFLSVIVLNHLSQACFEPSGTLQRHTVSGINQLNVMFCLHWRDNSPQWEQTRAGTKSITIVKTLSEVEQVTVN